jgi:hypothetical protein
VPPLEELSHRALKQPSHQVVKTSGMALRPQPTRATLFGGGTDGNEQLTAMTGVLLIVLLAGLGVSIVQIGQLIWLHLFLGLVLIGPVGLKMISTGYRFVRYYSRSPVYVEKGPPQLALRAIAPLVVLTTVVVFASGIWLMLTSPLNRSTPLLVHKASFFVWLAVTALHVLGHLPGLGAISIEGGGFASQRLGSPAAAGAAGRWIALAGAIVAGLVLALVLIPHFSLWTAPRAFAHHEH